MIGKMTSHQWAILQAVLVTILWSSSWVLIKIGLRELPPLNFAAYRYLLASIFLGMGFVARGERLTRQLPWAQLVILAILAYTVAQGAQFAALGLIPATVGSFILSTIPLWVALAERLGLGQPLHRQQLAGMGLCILGAYVFFYPLQLGTALTTGGLIMLLSAWSSAGATVLARSFQLGPHVGALRLTTVSMALGSTMLLGLAWAWEGIAVPSVRGWLIIGYLAAVNTAFAWTLWNHVLRTLPAFEISVLGNLMLIEIAVLAWVFLGEALTFRQWAAIAVLLAGITLVHWQRAQWRERFPRQVEESLK